MVIIGALTLIISRNAYEMLCHCHVAEDPSDKINIAIRATILVVEISNFLFFNTKLI